MLARFFAWLRKPFSARSSRSFCSEKRARRLRPATHCGCGAVCSGAGEASGAGAGSGAGCAGAV